LIGGLGIIAASGLLYNTANANANSGCALPPLDHPTYDETSFDPLGWPEEQVGGKEYLNETWANTIKWHEWGADNGVIYTQRMSSEDLVGVVSAKQITEERRFGVESAIYRTPEGEITQKNLDDMTEGEMKYFLEIISTTDAFVHMGAVIQRDFDYRGAAQ
jgi:hypothetical protein